MTPIIYSFTVYQGYCIEIDDMYRRGGDWWMGIF